MSSDIHLDLIDRVEIASPCSMKWEDLDGDGCTRHCRQCELDVHNFSDMTRTEVESILANTTGRLCATWYRRADGTMMTRDCPVGLAAVRRHARRAAVLVGGFLTLLIAGGMTAMGFRTARSDVTDYGPIMGDITMPAVQPMPAPPVLMGEVCAPEDQSDQLDQSGQLNQADPAATPEMLGEVKTMGRVRVISPTRNR